MTGNLIESIFKIGSAIADIWWCYWSNKRSRKMGLELGNVPLEESDKIEEIRYGSVAKLVSDPIYNKKYKYTKDGIKELWDAINPPGENYKAYLKGKLEDDCDGYHSLTYHLLKNNGVECYLLSVTTIGAGHCVLLCKVENKWYVNDYTSLWKEPGYDAPNEAIEAYNKRFETTYNTKHPVLHNGLVAYDYEKGEFYLVDLKSL